MFKQETGGMSNLAPQKESVVTPESEANNLRGDMLKQLTAFAERSRELLHEIEVIKLNKAKLSSEEVAKLIAKCEKEIMEKNAQAMELNRQMSEDIKKLGV